MTSGGAEALAGVPTGLPGLNDRDKVLVRKLLSHPLEFPQEFLGWLPRYLETHPPRLSVVEMDGYIAPSTTVTMTGQVGATGTITAGTGFTITKGATGIYTVVFSEAFRTAPTVHVTAVISTGTRIGVIASVTTAQAVIHIRTDGNALSNNAFHFIALTTT